MPGIHGLLFEKVLILKKDVDGRDKPGHDGETNLNLRRK
jgi:hypothetical protein